MKSVEIRAHAKVNLSLNVTGALGELHTLESVVSGVDLHDDICVSFNRSGEIQTRFFAGDELCEIPEENSVTKAVRFLRRYLPRLGANVAVRKNIPLAGGLGGSSADAAAVISAAISFFPELDEDGNIIAESAAVGSDVPVMTAGGCAVMGGTGGVIRPIDSCELHLAIACGKGGVQSGAAYKLFDELYPQKSYCPSDTQRLVRALNAGDLKAIAPELKNALTEPARKLCGSVDIALTAIERTGAAAVFMTGSGNCCCGLYETEHKAREAAEKLRASGLWAKYAHTLDKR